MPSTSIFEKQSNAFKNNLLKSSNKEIFVIEAGSTMYWNKLTNPENIFGIDEFGLSAPASQVYNYFGLNAKKISTKILKKVE